MAHEISVSQFKVYALSATATALARADDKEQALVILKQAEEVAQKINRPAFKAYPLRDIALALVAAGEFKQVMDLARNIEDSLNKSSVLNQISRALAKEGDFKRAMEIVDEIDGVKDTRSRRKTKAAALSYIALAQAKTGDKEQALVILEQAKRITEIIRKPADKAEVMEAMASVLIAAEEFEQAIEMAQKIEDDSSKLYALIGIASTLAMETVPNNKYEQVRMKIAFTPEEKQIAKQLVEAVQAKQ